MPRTTRYSALFDPTPHHATVIGVGAVGHQTALALASMGVASLTLIDPDTVSEENLGPQGFPPSDIDTPKVTSAAATCVQRNPALSLTTHHRRFIVSDAANIRPENHVVFLCIDDMDDRRFILTCLRQSLGSSLVAFESRMSSETCAIHPITSLAHFTHWMATWFPQSEAEIEPCTRRSTFHCAVIAAGLLISQWTNHLRGHPSPHRIQLAFTPTLLTTTIDLPPQ